MSRATDAEQVWRERVGDQRISGLSVARYCAEHALNESTFYLWRKRVGDARLPMPMKLVEVITTAPSTPPATACHGVIEIVLPGSLIVRLGGEVPVTRLREIIALLREPGSAEARS